MKAGVRLPSKRRSKAAGNVRDACVTLDPTAFARAIASLPHATNMSRKSGDDA